MSEDISNAFEDIGRAIQFTLENGFPTASVILTYLAIDAMASLIMPEDQNEVRREDFINWVEKYIKTKNQQYQYQGIDLWGARCGLVHRYSPISSLSESGECKQFKYHDGYGHAYDSSVDENLVSISAPDLVHDFYKAMQIFLNQKRGFLCVLC